MKRSLTVFLCLIFLIACGSPGSERAREEKVVEEELGTTDEPQQYKDPDGAFGAKDFATEAKELSERDTKALESAAEEIQDEQ